MNKNILWVYILSALIFFGRGLSDLPSSAFFFYMKETLHYDEQKIMWLGSIISLAWCVKPGFGYFVDAWGFSKKTWIIGSIILGAVTTLTLGFISSLPFVILVMTLLSTSQAIANISVDGVMCCVGKQFGITGKIQSIQWGAITLAGILTGVVGGWLSDHTTYQNCYLMLLPVYAIMLFVTLKYTDSNVRSDIKLSFIDSIKKIFTDKNMILVCAFLFLWNFSPSFGTPLSFIQRDTFHWSRTFMGVLSTISAIGAVAGAWIYWHVSKKLDLRKCLYWAVGLGATTSLAYLYYTPVSCIVYDILFSIAGMFTTLLILDFMARESKLNMETMTFALLCSVTNLTGTLNSFVGGWLFPIVGLKWLIIISASTSFLCLPLIKRLKI